MKCTSDDITKETTLSNMLSKNCMFDSNVYFGFEEEGNRYPKARGWAAIRYKGTFSGEDLEQNKPKEDYIAK